MYQMSHCENSNLRNQKEQGQSIKQKTKKNILRTEKGFVKRNCSDCSPVKYSNDSLGIKRLKNRKEKMLRRSSD